MAEIKYVPSDVKTHKDTGKLDNDVLGMREQTVGGISGVYIMNSEGT